MTFTLPPLPRRAYTVKEFKEAYRLSHTYVYELIKDGRLPDVKVGGRRLIPADAAEALLRPKEPA